MVCGIVCHGVWYMVYDRMYIMVGHGVWYMVYDRMLFGIVCGMVYCQVWYRGRRGRLGTRETWITQDFLYSSPGSPHLSCLINDQSEHKC